jgi:DNA adenine methylase
VSGESSGASSARRPGTGDVPRLRTPTTYYGGRQRLAKTYISLLLVHDTYHECFGGGAALLITKPPSRHEIHNDKESEVVNFFRMVNGEARAKS